MATKSDYRERCIREKGTDCALCGSEEGRDVLAHHINGHREDNGLDNLMPVCAECHRHIHTDNDVYQEWTGRLERRHISLDTRLFEDERWRDHLEFIRKFTDADTDEEAVQLALDFYVEMEWETQDFVNSLPMSVSAAYTWDGSWANNTTPGHIITTMFERQAQAHDNAEVVRGQLAQFIADLFVGDPALDVGEMGRMRFEVWRDNELLPKMDGETCIGVAHRRRSAEVLEADDRERYELPPSAYEIRAKRTTDGGDRR